jgi:cell pole-organizing protein PopZ
MTDTNQEPTMEEILASIRRIISEDDGPTDDGATTPPAAVEAAPQPAPAFEAEPEPEPEPYVAPAAEADEADEVLDLTDRVETIAAAPSAPPVESVGDLDVYSQAEPPPAPAPRAAQPAWKDDEQDALVSGPTARTAASSFDHLASSLIMPSEGRTLEDVVRELLRPLLKSWLDENLPAIVQAKVEAEVERIARSRVR